MSFAQARGEWLAIEGASGSGKSTLAGAMIGALPEAARTGGRVFFEGVELLSCPPSRLASLRGSGIAATPQEPAESLHPLTPVGIQIESRLRSHGITAGPVRASAPLLGDEAARICALYPHQLSGGQRQRIVVGQLLALKPRLLITDEPTSAIDDRRRCDLLSLLASLRNTSRTSVLLLSHDRQALRCADRLLLLRNGTIDAELRGTAMRDFLAHRDLDKAEPSRDADQLVLSCEGIRKRYGSQEVLRGIDLTLHRAGCVSVSGESGAGKSTLARCLAGIEAPDSGSIRRAAGPRSVQLMFQESRTALNPFLRARDAVAEAALLGNQANPSDVAEGWLDRVGLPRTARLRRCATLSGGERQRVALARALASNPSVLVLDEPTRGLDAAAQTRIIEVLREVNRDTGLALIVISHDPHVQEALGCVELRLEAGRFSPAGADLL